MARNAATKSVSNRSGKKANVRGNEIHPSRTSRCSAYAGGVKTADQFVGLMSAVMSDLITGSMVSGTAQAIVSAGRAMLRCSELQSRYNLSRNSKDRAAGFLS